MPRPVSALNTSCNICFTEGAIRVGIWRTASADRAHGKTHMGGAAEPQNEAQRFLLGSIAYVPCTVHFTVYMEHRTIAVLNQARLAICRAPCS